MSRKDQSVLKFWDKFIKAYVSHHDYWYFPKARAVNNVAMARILKVTFDNLGFSWIDENDNVSLTPAGKTFIETANPIAIFDRQLWRYQIANPLWPARGTIPRGTDTRKTFGGHART
jgi:hypothetical protein